MPPAPRPSPAPGYRWCGGCQIEQPEDEFSGTERSCRWAKYLSHIRRKYGVTPKQYEAWMEENGGRCPICRSRPAKYLDHCHTTGKARGVLCQPCNTALGAFSEDPVVFDRALAYLASGR